MNTLKFKHTNGKSMLIPDSTRSCCSQANILIFQVLIIFWMLAQMLESLLQLFERWEASGVNVAPHLCFIQ